MVSHFVYNVALISIPAPTIPGQATLRFETVLNDISDGKIYWVKTGGVAECSKYKKAKDKDWVSIIYSGESAQNKLKRSNHWSVQLIF